MEDNDNVIQCPCYTNSLITCNAYATTIADENKLATFE